MTGYVGDGAPIDAGQWSANTAQLHQQGYGNVQTSATDASMNVIFYKRAVHHEQMSIQAGRPMYVDVDFVKIHQPGERLNIVEREANASDKRRWPQHWANYAANKEQVVDGTPLGLLFPRHPAVIANLQAIGFMTVEQLSNASASAIDAIGMHGQDYVNYAQQYLKSASGGAAFHKMQAENEEMKRHNDRLNKQVQELTGQVAAVNQAILSQAGVTVATGALNRSMPAPAPAEPIKPYMPPAPSFGHVDAQSTMINANHESGEQAKKPGWPKGKPRKPKDPQAA